jgi:hypothetical protein
LSGIVFGIQRLNATDSKNPSIQRGATLAIRFWRKLFWLQFTLPWGSSISRPGLTFIAALAAAFGLVILTQHFGPMVNIAWVHFEVPITIGTILPVFVFMTRMLMKFKVTAPVLRRSEGIARGLRLFAKGFWERTRITSGQNQDAGIAVGELATAQGLFEERKFRLTEDNLNYHVEIIGGSGAGKTNFLKLLISDRIQKGHGLIFVDLKADFETVDWITAQAIAAKRETALRVFSLMDRDISVGYNPVGSGGLNELHSRIMQSFQWSEEYYRKAASTALSDILLGLCEVREKTGEQFSLKTIHELLLSPERLDAFCLRREMSQESREILKARSLRLRTKDGAQEILGLTADLQNLIRSSGGKLITEDASGPGAIDLMRAIARQEIVYFLMNSMQDKESSVAVGKLFLQDLISTVGRIYREVPETERRPVTLIVDEFASFATENFIDLINRARGAGMGIVVAHQSRGDLRQVSENFCDQLERNANTKVIFGTDNADDAEYFAAMIGTKKTLKETLQVEDGLLWSDVATGRKSVREVEEFLVHPNEIKRLKQGQALIIKRLRDAGFGVVNLYSATIEEGGETIDASRILSEIRLKSLQTKFATIELPRLAVPSPVATVSPVVASPSVASDEEQFT